jgi:hypothetical protein
MNILFVVVHRDRLLNPENQTTKSPRLEEGKAPFSFFFVPLCLRGSFLILGPTACPTQ